MAGHDEQFREDSPCADGQITANSSPRPAPFQEGRFAIVTNRWVQDAMDACRAKRRTHEQADGEAAWF